MPLPRRLLLALVALAPTGVAPVRAQEPALPSVDSIAVEGAVRNTRQQIISFSGLQTGQPATYRAVQRAIQGLFVTGQFDEVRAEQRQVAGKLVLVLVVTERPLLQKWTLKGADR